MFSINGLDGFIAWAAVVGWFWDIKSTQHLPNRIDRPSAFAIVRPCR